MADSTLTFKVVSGVYNYTRENVSDVTKLTQLQYTEELRAAVLTGAGLAAHILVANDGKYSPQELENAAICAAQNMGYKVSNFDI